MQTWGADPRGVRVEWRNGGGRTRLVGVTELGRLMGMDPNLPHSVLDSLGRWKAGRSAGGFDPQRKGWMRLQDQAGETGSNSSSSSSSGGRTRPPTPPPPRPPRKNPASRVARKTPPPQAQQSKPKGKGKGKATPPQTPNPPLAR